MGFGCLFVGYFFANMMPPVGSPLSVAKLIGYPLMIAAFYRLAPFQKRFLYCFFASFATLPFAVYYAMIGLSQFGVISAYRFLGGTVYTVVDICYIAVSLTVHVLMLLAVVALMKELGHQALLTTAWRNLICSASYFVLRGLMLIPCAMQKYLLAITLLLWVFMLFMNLFMLFKCYRYICPEGDEDMSDPLKLELPKGYGEEGIDGEQK